jgi:hypothetical protein
MERESAIQGLGHQGGSTILGGQRMMIGLLGNGKGKTRNIGGIHGMTIIQNQGGLGIGIQGLGHQGGSTILGGQRMMIGLLGNGKGKTRNIGGIQGMTIIQGQGDLGIGIQGLGHQGGRTILGGQ